MAVKQLLKWRGRLKWPLPHRAASGKQSRRKGEAASGGQPPARKSDHFWYKRHWKFTWRRGKSLPQRKRNKRNKDFVVGKPLGNEKSSHLETVLRRVTQTGNEVVCGRILLPSLLPPAWLRCSSTWPCVAWQSPCLGSCEKKTIPSVAVVLRFVGLTVPE